MGGKSLSVLRFSYKFCQNSTFHSFINLILRFTKEEAEVRKQGLTFVPACYMRTFDVISEVNCVFLQRKQRFKIFR